MSQSRRTICSLNACLSSCALVTRPSSHSPVNTRRISPNCKGMPASRPLSCSAFIFLAREERCAWRFVLAGGDGRLGSGCTSSFPRYAESKEAQIKRSSCACVVGVVRAPAGLKQKTSTPWRCPWRRAWSSTRPRGQAKARSSGRARGSRAISGISIRPHFLSAEAKRPCRGISIAVTSGEKEEGWGWRPLWSSSASTWRSRSSSKSSARRAPQLLRA